MFEFTGNKKLESVRNFVMGNCASPSRVVLKEDKSGASPTPQSSSWRSEARPGLGTRFQQRHKLKTEREAWSLSPPPLLQHIPTIRLVLARCSVGNGERERPRQGAMSYWRRDSTRRRCSINHMRNERGGYLEA